MTSETSEPTPTVYGPIQAADPELLRFIDERLKEDSLRYANRLQKEANERRRSEVRRKIAKGEEQPETVIDRLNEFTYEEKKILEYALKNGDSVNLPYAISNYSKTRTAKGMSADAIDKSIRRAAKRLNNRGVATLKKEDDGFIWCHIDRKKVLDVLRKETISVEGGGVTDINLIKVHCEFPTIASQHEKVVEKRRAMRNIYAMPSRTSSQRTKSVQLMKGVKMLERPDKVQINYWFEYYTSEVNEKILTLLDLNNGEVLGVEYSTRFNDMAKARKNLDKFDAAINTSLKDYHNAVFLTLTTDPNLTDEERAERRKNTIHDLERKLFLARSRHFISLESKRPRNEIGEKERKWLEKELLHAHGPEFEIAYLELKQMFLTKNNPDIQIKIDKLRSDKDKSFELEAAVNNPLTPIRTKERMVISLKRMNRWTYKHDPNGFKDLYESVKHFGIAWNKFMQYCAKHNKGIRPKYVVSYEFTESGLLHAHALIFVEYLMHNDKIAIEWKRCGQGEVSYIYGLKNVKLREPIKDKHGNVIRTREWKWKKGKPQDAKYTSGNDYVGKYVKKCLLAMSDRYTSPAEIQSLYWATNKRFFSNSRTLIPKEEEESIEIPEEDKHFFAFLRVFHEEDAATVVDRMIYHRQRPEDENKEGHSSEVYAEVVA